MHQKIGIRQDKTRNNEMKRDIGIGIGLGLGLGGGEVSDKAKKTKQK